MRCTWREDAGMYVFFYAWLVPLDWCLCCKEIDGLKHGSTEGRLTSVSRQPANISNPQMLFLSDSGSLMMFELHPGSMSRSAAPLFPGLEWSQKMQDFRMCMGCFQRVWRTLTVLASVVRMSSYLGSYTKVVWPFGLLFWVLVEALLVRTRVNPYEKLLLMQWRKLPSKMFLSKVA